MSTLTLLGTAKGSETISGPGPTSLTIPACTLAAGDVLVVEVVLDAAGADMASSNPVMWGSTPVPGAPFDYAQVGDSIGMAQFALEVATGGTADVVVAFAQPTHASVVHALRVTDATIVPGYYAIDVPSGTNTTIAVSVLDPGGDTIAIVAVGTLAYPPSSTDDMGTWDHSYVQGPYDSTTDGVVSNVDLSIGYKSGTDVGAETVNYTWTYEDEPGSAVIVLRRTATGPAVELVEVQGSANLRSLCGGVSLVTVEGD